MKRVTQKRPLITRVQNGRTDENASGNGMAESHFPPPQKGWGRCMSSVLYRSLLILEYLTDVPNGASLGAIATHLNLPPSAVHRLLRELVNYGYIRQDETQGTYRLSIKLASMGLSFLGQTGITDISQPILDSLAQQSKELVRLSVYENKVLTWIGVAQGATSGLRYDPGSEHGQVAHLASSSAGQAVLSTMSDEDALALVAEQGIQSKFETTGANAPTTFSQLLTILKDTRERGYSITHDSYFSGMAAMAAPIMADDNKGVLGAVSIAGPTVRFTLDRMVAMSEHLIKAADDLRQASRASQFFNPSTPPAKPSSPKRKK